MKICHLPFSQYLNHCCAHQIYASCCTTSILSNWVITLSLPQFKKKPKSLHKDDYHYIVGKPPFNLHLEKGELQKDKIALAQMARYSSTVLFGLHWYNKINTVKSIHGNLSGEGFLNAWYNKAWIPSGLLYATALNKQTQIFLRF